MEPEEEQLDIEDDDFGGVEQNSIFQTSQAVDATWADDDECDDLYNDLNVSFIQAPVIAYHSTKQEHVGNGMGQQKFQYEIEQTKGPIPGEGRIGEPFARSVGYIKHDEINKVEHGGISGNITEFSIQSRPKKDHWNDDEVKQNRGGMKKELRFGHPGPTSSTTSFTSNGNKAPKNHTMYENDESYMQQGSQGTNQYDKTEEGDKLVVPEQRQLFPGPRLVASPLEDRGSQVSAEAVESNMEVPEVLQVHARNASVSFRESAASGKAGGLNVGGGSLKSGGNNFGASSGQGSTSSPAVSPSDRIGPVSSPAASTSNRKGPSSTACTGQQDNSFLHSGVERGTVLFVGELHWWTTDADLETALSEYGKVKDIKFYEEKASGKSKGYCQVEFYDHTAAYKCKAGMHGRLFNGRPCVIAFSSPLNLGQLSSSQINKTRTRHQQRSETQTQQQPRRKMNDGDSSFYQSGEGRWNYGNKDSGRNGYAQGMVGRGWGCQGRGRGRNMGMNNMGRGGMASGAGPYGQGEQGLMRGTSTGTIAPHGLMAQGFNPLFGPHMARGGGIYGGYSHRNPFPGMIRAFPAVGAGLPGVAPHDNPSFWGQGITTSGMGMLPTAMQMDGSIGRWVGQDQNRQMTDYEEDAKLDYGYGNVKHQRGRSIGKRDRESISEEDARLDHGYGGMKHERDRSTDKRARESISEEDARLDHGYGDLKHERGRSTGKRARESIYEEDARLDHGYGGVKHERRRSTERRDRESIHEEDAVLDHGHGDVEHESGRSTGKRDRESIYEKYTRLDHGYGEVKHERGRSGATKNQDRGLNSEWVGASERQCLGDREVHWNRDGYRDDRDAYKDQRGRDQSWEKYERDKEKLLKRQNNQRSQSKEMDYAKRLRPISGRKE